MKQENRGPEVTRAVWRQSYETWISRPETERREQEPAVNVLLAVLRGCRNEEELHARYWQPGDWPAPVLVRQLPGEDAALDELLTLEEAAFWLRCLELQEGLR